MAVVSQPIDQGQAMIFFNGETSLLDIGRQHGTEEGLAQDETVLAQKAKERLRDVRGHADQALLGSALLEDLVFVLIGLHDLHLADPVDRRSLIDFTQKRHFEAPSGRYPDAAREVRDEGKLAGKRVPEIVQIGQKRIEPQDAPERPDQWGVKKSGDPAVQLVADPGVIALAEFKIRGGVDHRKDESREEFALIVDDVAIVERDGVDIFVREDVTHGHPDGLPFPGIVQVEVGPAKFLIE